MQVRCLRWHLDRRTLKQLGIVAKYTPPSAARLPKQFIDKDGYWVATNYYVYTPALNIELWPRPSDRKPLPISSILSSRQARLVVVILDVIRRRALSATVLTHMGEEKGMDFLRKLAGQNMCR